QRIITELRIYDDPDLPYYNEIFRFYYSGYTGSEELLDALNNKIEITQQVMKILDADIKKEELGNLTYGRYILNAINEEELVEMGIKTGSPGQANGEYFSKLGKNLANWESQLSKFLLKKIIEATCTAIGAPALSIGISTLGLFIDLSIIGTSINRLNEVWYEKAFWSYIKFRNEPNNYGHTDAWTQLPESYINHIFLLLSPEKWKETKEAIEENFESLWNKYGGHIVNNELDKNFKSQQRESLKILLLYALGAEPHLIITSPLKITPSSPYQVEDIINAEFTITNQGMLPISFSVLTVGGRNSDNQVTDFTHRQNIILKPFESHDYKGTLTLNKVGDYHFFCTYQTPDGNWNTSIDLGPDLTDEDRVVDIIVIEGGVPSIVPDKKVYTVQVGAFSAEGDALNLAKEIKSKGYKTYVIKGKTLYKVQVGEFKSYQEAQNISQKLKELGYPFFITTRLPDNKRKLNLKQKNIPSITKNRLPIQNKLGGSVRTIFLFYVEGQSVIYQFLYQKLEYTNSEKNKRQKGIF
ncbi:SPOR domain-containing protein, partial [bacterium]|nr:SPOR domain-containing protein [bacterium]